VYQGRGFHWGKAGYFRYHTASCEFLFEVVGVDGQVCRSIDVNMMFKHCRFAGTAEAACEDRPSFTRDVGCFGVYGIEDAVVRKTPIRLPNLCVSVKRELLVRGEAFFACLV